MTPPPVLDLDALLAPISEAEPTGVDPREDGSANSPYYAVKDARGRARAVERSSVEVGAAPPDAWYEVVEAGTRLLTTTAKDLEVAAWVTEALVRTEGFAGLRDGLVLIRGLVDAFWDKLYPMPDEDGIETRVAAVSGLNGVGAPGTLAQPIRMITLFGEAMPFSIWQYDQTLEVDKITDEQRKQARLDAGAYTMEQFRQSLAETEPAMLGGVLATVEECLTALAAMAASFDAVAGYDAPPTSALRDLLENIAGSIRYFGSDKLVGSAGVADLQSSEASGTNGALGEGGADRPASVGLTKTSGFASREEALQVLVGIAAYFKKTEPQSPISYTLEEAVRRARLSLPELLEELTQDPAHSSYFLTAAGIRVKKEESAQSSW